MTQGVKEAWDKCLNNDEQMRLIPKGYATKKACSVQEAVSHIMSELWLRKIFPVVVFANINLKGNRLWVSNSEQKIKDVPDSLTESF